MWQRSAEWLKYQPCSQCHQEKIQDQSTKREGESWWKSKEDACLHEVHTFWQGEEVVIISIHVQTQSI